MALSGNEAAAKLEKGIGNIKNVLFCLNILAFILGLVLFGMTMYVRFDTDIQTWVEQLLISDFYWGVWILILFSAISVGVTFLSCASTITEHPTLLLANTGAQMLCFVVGMVGAAMLKDYSTYKSDIQPVIRKQMLRLISMYPDDYYATTVLRTIQENVGCCGADGVDDYIGLRRALPAECRDTVTGNCYFHGCVDEVTWTLDERCTWPIGMAITICFINVVNSVLSFSLLQAVQKQDEVLAMYNR